jgi:hypothetical protein
MKTKIGSVQPLNMDNNDVLIYDIETETFGARPNAKVDKLKIFGFYSYKINKYCLIPFTDKEAIQKVINNHKFIVGFNNEKYDDPILEREGISLEYKRIIDLRKIIKMRAGSMVTKKGMLGNVLMKYSLDYITRFLGLVDDKSAKGEMDYNILKKNKWTPEEVKEIKEYTIRDLEITKKLYEWVSNYFDAFKDFVPKKDVEGKYYLTDSMAKFGYKADCHALGLEPIYNFDFVQTPEDERISGGYCSYPAGEKFSAKKIIKDDGTIDYEDIIIQLDFSSLYPHLSMMANLNARNKDRTGWHGGKMFEVEGYYDDTKMSGLGLLLRKWYYLRLMYKRKGILEDGTVFKYKDIDKYKGKKSYYIPADDGVYDLKLSVIDDDTIKFMKNLVENGVDRREYTIKILLNLQYGILNQQYYQLVYDSVAGGDCTRLGRQCIRYARKVFREAGYILINSDTDSWYFVDVFNDKKKYLALKNKVIADIKSSMPFPQITFDADIDAIIKHIFFFKGKKKEVRAILEL